MNATNSTNLNGSNPRYKTMLCKHFSKPQGCSYGDKCQFAHGMDDLRPYEGKILPQKDLNQMKKQQQKNPLNYKIIKCKNWEKDGTCKYGKYCTFAHGDGELRNKADNLCQIQPNAPGMQMMYPFLMMNPMMGRGMNMPMNMPMNMGMNMPMNMGMNMPMNMGVGMNPGKFGHQNKKNIKNQNDKEIKDEDKN